MAIAEKVGEVKESKENLRVAVIERKRQEYK